MTSFDRTTCPTCGGNGHREHPFDANCPAAWAHDLLSSWGELSHLRESLRELEAENERLANDALAIAGHLDAAERELAVLRESYETDLTLERGKVDDLLKIIDRSRESAPKLWTCPDCNFAFAAEHTNDDGSGYSCPVCESSALEAENARIKASALDKWELEYVLACIDEVDGDIMCILRVNAEAKLRHPSLSTEEPF